MTNTKKQLKITKLFRKGGATRLPEDCDDIQEEIQRLQQKLKEKQDELFQVQRNNYKRKVIAPKKKTEMFIRPQKIVLNNSVESLKRSLELMGMLTGMEVKSYVADDHCCIEYLMQSNTQFEVKHGLRIEMKTGDHEISKSSLPVGFNMKAVMENYQNVMMPECLGAIRKALVAYYDRLQQFEKLKKLLLANIESQLFKLLDGSHIEISFYAQSEADKEEDNQVNVTLILDYRVYDIMPKVYSFKESDLPEGVSEILKQQCIVFKKKPLHKAFKEAFITGVGVYTLVQQVGAVQEQRQRPQKRPRKHRHHHNDDTFLPEECSDQGEDDEPIDD